MLRRGARVALIIAAASMASCARLIGVDDWDAGQRGEGGATSGASGASGASGGAVGSTGVGSGGASQCAGGTACVAGAPPGWIGPVIRYDGQGPVPACPPAWVSPGINAQRNLLVPPNPCATCSCGTPAGACQLVLSTSSQASCASQNATFLLNDGSCTQISQPGGYVTASTAVTGAGFCPPSGGDLLPTSWEAVDTFCIFAPADGRACPGGSCAPPPPPPFGGAYCVLSPGQDVACPGAPYTTKTLVHGGVSDTRMCSPCGCGAPTGVGCAGEVDLYEMDNCTKPIVSIDPTANQCPNSPTSIATAQWAPVVGGGCTQSGGTASGSAVATLPTTVCCAE